MPSTNASTVPEKDEAVQVTVAEAPIHFLFEGPHERSMPPNGVKVLKGIDRVGVHRVDDPDRNSELSESEAVAPYIKGHAVRHVATSLASLRVSSIPELLAAGAWNSPNTFVNFYLQDFTTDDLSGLSKLGGFVAAGVVIT